MNRPIPFRLTATLSLALISCAFASAQLPTITLEAKASQAKVLDDPSVSVSKSVLVEDGSQLRFAATAAYIPPRYSVRSEPASDSVGDNAQIPGNVYIGNITAVGRWHLVAYSPFTTPRVAFAKFVPPTIGGGKVFRATFGDEATCRNQKRNGQWVSCGSVIFYGLRTRRLDEVPEDTGIHP